MPAQPLISHVSPDYPVSLDEPRILTGEHFDAPGLEVWAWTPSCEQADIRAACGRERPALPAEPPDDAKRGEILDVEPRVITATTPGDVVWVRSEHGCSEPVLLNAARAYWVGEENVRAGRTLAIFGMTLWPTWHGGGFNTAAPSGYVALVPLDGDGEPVFVERTREGRSTQWINDPRLVHIIVPRDTAPGRYAVEVHNGCAGRFGWSRAGDVVVSGAETETPYVVDVRDCGAAGDGLADDTQAVAAAMRAAAGAGGGTVHLAPGTYRVTETVRTPAGVCLRGAGRENTVLVGDGYDPTGGEPPAALLALTDRTGVSDLTLTGAVAQGVASRRDERPDRSADAMVRLLAEDPAGTVEDVHVLNCRLRTLEETPHTRDMLYLKAIHVGHDCFGRCRRVKICSNEIDGSLFFYRADRMHVIRNTFRHSTPTINVSIHGWATDSLLDSNLFVDRPGRVCFYPLRHCCIRYNEIRGAFMGTWTNAEEVYLVHGSADNYFGEEYERVVSTATAADADSLTDATQSWLADEHAESYVLIIEGRGFGQYRRVLSNTPTQLRLDRPWSVQPDETSRYLLARMHVENVFYANCNQTPGRMSIWMDAIGNVIDLHRDEFSKGIDIWGCNHTSTRSRRPRPEHRFLPAWYNRVQDGWQDGAFLLLHGHGRSKPLVKAPAMFGNVLAGNRVRQPYMARTGFTRGSLAAGGIRVGVTERSERRPPGKGVISHSLVVGNGLSFSPVGITVMESARKTFCLHNVMEHVDKPLLDRGEETLFRDNRRCAVDDSGISVTPIDGPNG